jgi:hypothetical protein
MMHDSLLNFHSVFFRHPVQCSGKHLATLSLPKFNVHCTFNSTPSIPVHSQTKYTIEKQLHTVIIITECKTENCFKMVNKRKTSNAALSAQFGSVQSSNYNSLMWKSR